MSNYVTTPTVGMGATMQVGSDSYACTIVAYHPPKGGKPARVVIQRDATRVTTDERGKEMVEYLPRPTAECESFTLRKSGSWVHEGQAMHNGRRLAVGKRYSYRDPSF